MFKYIFSLFLFFHNYSHAIDINNWEGNDLPVFSSYPIFFREESANTRDPYGRSIGDPHYNSSFSDEELRKVYSDNIGMILEDFKLRGAPQLFLPNGFLLPIEPILIPGLLNSLPLYDLREPSRRLGGIQYDLLTRQAREM